MHCLRPRQVSVDLSEYDYDDDGGASVATSLADSIAAAVSTGALTSSMASYASEAGITFPVTVTGSSAEVATDDDGDDDDGDDASGDDASGDDDGDDDDGDDASGDDTTSTSAPVATSTSAPGTTSTSAPAATSTSAPAVTSTSAPDAVRRGLVESADGGSRRRLAGFGTSWYSFALADSGADGWNGASYTFTEFDTGVVVTSGTMESGSTATVNLKTVGVEIGVCYTLAVSAGSWPSEVSWTIGGSSGLSGAASTTIYIVYVEDTSLGANGWLTNSFGGCLSVPPSASPAPTISTIPSAVPTPAPSPQPTATRDNLFGVDLSNIDISSLIKSARCVFDVYGDGSCDTVNNHFGCGFDGGDCCSYTVVLPDDQLPFCDTLSDDDDDASGRRLEEESMLAEEEAMNEATERGARESANDAVRAAVKAAAAVVAEASSTEPALIAGIGELLTKLSILTGQPEPPKHDHKHTTRDDVQAPPSSLQPWRTQRGSEAGQVSQGRKLLSATSAPSPLPTSVPTSTSAPTQIPTPVPSYSYSYDPDCARTCFGTSCNTWVVAGEFTCSALES